MTLAKILVPETQPPLTRGTVRLDVERDRHVMDAAATGARDGLRLARNVGAMLLAFSRSSTRRCNGSALTRG